VAGFRGKRLPVAGFRGERPPHYVLEAGG